MRVTVPWLYEITQNAATVAVCVVLPGEEVREVRAYSITQATPTKYRASRLPDRRLSAEPLAFSLEQVLKASKKDPARILTFSSRKIKERPLLTALHHEGAFGRKAQEAYEKESARDSTTFRRERLPLTYKFNWTKKVYGLTVKEAIDKRPGFIAWALGKWPNFLDEEALAYYNKRTKQGRR